MTTTIRHPLCFSAPLVLGLGASILVASPSGCSDVDGDSWAIEDEADEAELRIETSITCPSSSGDQVWPLGGQAQPTPNVDRIQDVYGGIIRSLSYYNHRGVDFGAPQGAEIHAVADGFITRKCVDGQANCSMHSGKGNWLLLQHLDAGANGETLYTVYGHMSSFDTDGMGTELVEGDCVAAGDVIGLVGDTGSASSMHLHLELHADLSDARSPGIQSSLNPWLVLPDKLTPVSYSATNLGPSVGGDVQVRVRAEAQYANIGRVEAVRFNTLTCGNQTCHVSEAETRTLDWDGLDILICGPACGDFRVEPKDFNHDAWDLPNDPFDTEHEWSFYITPSTAAAGDEVYRVYDVFDRLVAEGALD